MTLSSPTSTKSPKLQIQGIEPQIINLTNKSPKKNVHEDNIVNIELRNIILSDPQTNEGETPVVESPVQKTTKQSPRKSILLQGPYVLDKNMFKSEEPQPSSRRKKKGK